MSVTKAAPPTPTVSGVSVTVTTGIPRSGAGVKVTGEEFHKHKFSNTGQQHWSIQVLQLCHGLHEHGHEPDLQQGPDHTGYCWAV